MRLPVHRTFPVLLLAWSLPTLAQAVAAKPASPAEQKPAPAAPATAAPQPEPHCTADVKTCLKQIVGKLSKRGWIGMEVALNPATNLPVVNSVTPGGPADNGGLKVGDLLLSQGSVRYDAKKNEDLEVVEVSHRQKAVGDVVTYVVRRDGKKMEFDVLLAQAPETQIATWLGYEMYFDYYKEAPPPAPKAPSPPPASPSGN
jgi:S1-C subfamily serine protease